MSSSFLDEIFDDNWYTFQLPKLSTCIAVKLIKAKKIKKYKTKVQMYSFVAKFYFSHCKISWIDIRTQKYVINSLTPSINSQVALKRQQAVEDAIALRLASTETGKTMEALPPGKIFGMTVTEPKTVDATSTFPENRSSDDAIKKQEPSSTSKSPLVSQNAIEMLSSLFPHRKRSVLELVLRRCDLDLLR